jgi:hypothetical protein
MSLLCNGISTHTIFKHYRSFNFLIRLDSSVDIDFRDKPVVFTTKTYEPVNRLVAS